MYTDCDQTHLTLLVGETLGHAVVDTGCPCTVAGNEWLKTYVTTLSRKDRLSIRTRNSNNKFSFGDGSAYQSKCNVIVPIYVGQCRYELSIDVVDCNIPLLLSRETLRRAKAKIDVEMATICLLGVTVPLIITSTGHLCLSISRSLNTSNEETRKVLSRVLFNSPIEGVGLDLKNKVSKLHLQFCHPTAERLINLLKNAGTTDKRTFDVINEVTLKCDVCMKNKKPPLRPAVSFPLASSFNEVVALDLKSRGSEGYILHMIDHLTRYSSACVISNKRKETIVKGVLEYWIRIFGPPKYFLSDNGGEFVNDEMIDLAEKFNISLKTTAAESPWSNGLCERHNGILNDNVNKLLGSGNFSLDTAIHWAVAAKNALANVYGFSPNILVFGRNTNLPNVFINKPPANNPTCLSDYVAENLAAMRLARENFIQQEAAERLRRALSRKSRTYSNKTFCQGDLVYYYRNNNSEWHGPAVVIGRDSQQILVKHGGTYIRVHPCRLQALHNQNMSQSLPDNQIPENGVDMSRDSSSDEDSYSTADDEENCSRNVGTNDSNVVATMPPSTPIDDQVTPIDESGLWTSVTSTKDLPKVHTTVECKFPRHDSSVRCTILSRAGKSTTANWHYLNVQESGSEQGKCCSFKDVRWRPIVDSENDQEHASQEVFYGLCDPAFDRAKLEEIEKWRLFQTFLEVPDNGEKAITTRWVCTRKIKGNQVVHKARLVARGFEEDQTSFQKDSPTCSKESLRLLLAILSSQSWKLHSLDVKSAFLQGIPMQRTVFIRPPKEAKSVCLWRMLRCPYGLADAGRHWYNRLKKELLEMGMEICKFDKALFMYYENTKLSGLLACHVDDIIFGGEPNFHKHVISKLRSVLVIGVEENTNFKYLGLCISQQTDGITVSTKEYEKSLEQISCPNVRTDEDTEFTPEDCAILRKFAGQVNWLSSQARPDISFDCCYIANSLKSNNIKVFDIANKLVRRVKNQQLNLRFPSSFDFKSCTIVAFCDASFANLLNAASQGGFLLFLTDKNGMYSPIAWQSRKIRRVVKSTLAAECLSAVEAAEMMIYIASLLKNLLNSKDNFPTYLYCDNKNLVNSVHSTTNLEDKRLVIDVSVLRDLLEQEELTKFIWVPTRYQLADTFTKQGASDKQLIEVLNDKSLRFDLSTGSFK